MAMEIKHLQTSEADEISRLRAENAELKANVAQLEDNVAFWKKKLDDEMASRRDEYEEAEKKIRRLKRALWLARSYRGRDNNILLPSKFMRNVWDNVERKCLKKAEQYK